MRQLQATETMGLHRHASGEFIDKKPRHLAIILQGQRAWAMKHTLSPDEAAGAAFRCLFELIDHCRARAIKRVTFCAFSEDLQSMPQGQNLALLRTLALHITSAEQNLHRMHARVCSDVCLPSEDAFIGRHLLSLSYKTRFNKGMLMNFIVDNPKLGCWNGPRRINGSSESCPDRAAKAVPIDADTEPDFVIRTGGPLSVQNSMLWYTGRTALYFTDALWPDFDAHALKDALDWFGLESREKGHQTSSTCDEVLRIL